MVGPWVADVDHGCRTLAGEAGAEGGLHQEADERSRGKAEGVAKKVSYHAVDVEEEARRDERKGRSGDALPPGRGPGEALELAGQPTKCHLLGTGAYSSSGMVPPAHQRQIVRFEDEFQTKK